jgi:hypothetical protein
MSRPLTGLGDEVVIAWYWLDHIWDKTNPAARFTRPGSAAAGCEWHVLWSHSIMSLTAGKIGE